MPLESGPHPRIVAGHVNSGLLTRTACEHYTATQTETQTRSLTMSFALRPIFRTLQAERGEDTST